MEPTESEGKWGILPPADNGIMNGRTGSSSTASNHAPDQPQRWSLDDICHVYFISIDFRVFFSPFSVYFISLDSTWTQIFIVSCYICSMCLGFLTLNYLYIYIFLTLLGKCYYYFSFHHDRWWYIFVEKIILWEWLICRRGINIPTRFLPSLLYWIVIVSFCFVN